MSNNKCVAFVILALSKDCLDEIPRGIFAGKNRPCQDCIGSCVGAGDSEIVLLSIIYRGRLLEARRYVGNLGDPWGPGNWILYLPLMGRVCIVG